MHGHDQFLNDVSQEIHYAVRRHPFPNPNLACLMEEAGELAQAMLQKRNRSEIYSECVQVAAMAMRCALEGDPQFNGK